MQGIDTVDQLAEVKSVVPRITRRSTGWAVLNGDDPRVLAMRGIIKAQPWVFSPGPRLARDPRGAQRRGPRDDRDRRLGHACSRPGADPDPLVELVDVPMTLAGLSRFNVENTLAAASAALAIGIPASASSRGCARSSPTPSTTRGG